MTERSLKLFTGAVFFIACLMVLAHHNPTRAVDEQSSASTKSAADEALAHLNGLVAVDLCYRLAASNLDTNRPTGYPGVRYAEIEGDRAVDACAIAVAYRSDDAGLQCNYGRALDASKRYDEAVDWYRKSADQGYYRAQNNLGMKYVFGEGVAQDYSQAAQWFQKAADQGDALAQRNLGDLYYKGQGVSQDYVKAAYWYNKANPDSQ